MDRPRKHRPVMTFDIDEKELWVGTLRRAGLVIVQEHDGSRWVDIDELFDFLTRTNAALRRLGEES